MFTNSYVVSGMTCGHCVSSVTEEVKEVPGVTDVAVDLASGRLEVTGADSITDEQIADAVAEAGYALA